MPTQLAICAKKIVASKLTIFKGTSMRTKEETFMQNSTAVTKYLFFLGEFTGY